MAEQWNTYFNKKHKYCEYISELALKSILFEVSTTPKPGLVDRENSGAHRDMDFFTFLKSSATLSSEFYKFTLAGVNFKGKKYNELLEEIRIIGMESEKKMFYATEGVNTHKGIIFSLGIICAAIGSIFNENLHIDIRIDEIINRVKEMSRGLVKKELINLQNKTNLTYGEKLFKKYGVTGIRGEVENGFPTVILKGIPILKRSMEQYPESINDNFLQTLISLMTETEDINILGRHNMDTLYWVKEQAIGILKIGGVYTEKGKKRIMEMDKEFIEKNISPGGSADLLAVSIMLYLIESPKPFYI